MRMLIYSKYIKFKKRPEEVRNVRRELDTAKEVVQEYSIASPVLFVFDSEGEGQA